MRRQRACARVRAGEGCTIRRCWRASYSTPLHSRRSHARPTPTRPHAAVLQRCAPEVDEATSKAIYEALKWVRSGACGIGWWWG